MKMIFIFSILLGINISFLYGQKDPKKTKKIISKTYPLEPTQEPSGRSAQTFDKNGNELESIYYDENGRITMRSDNVYDSTGKIIEHTFFWQWFIPHDYGGTKDEVHRYYFYDEHGNFKYDSTYATHNGVSTTNVYTPFDFSSESPDKSGKKFNKRNDLIEEVLYNKDTIRYEYNYDLQGNKIKSTCYGSLHGKPILSYIEWYSYNSQGNIEQDSSVSFHTDTMTVIWVNKYDQHGNSLSQTGYTYSTGERHPVHQINHKYVYDKQDNWIEWETIDLLEKTREVTKRDIVYY